MDCSTPGFPVLHHLLEFAQTQIPLVMPSNLLTLCPPILLPSIFPSIRSFPMSLLFASGGQSIRASEWPQLGHSVAPQSRKSFFCHVPPLAGRSNLTLHLGIDQPMTGFQSWLSANPYLPWFVSLFLYCILLIVGSKCLKILLWTEKEFKDTQSWIGSLTHKIRILHLSLFSLFLSTFHSPFTSSF